MYKREKLAIEDEIEFMEHVFNRYKKVKTRKTRDYGGLKHYRLGLVGHISDIARKTERLVNLVIRQGNFNIGDLPESEELLDDTVNDLLGYVIMLLHEIAIQRYERNLKTRRDKYQLLRDENNSE
ncbi:MAG: hypothetical protein CMB80_07930 [Flammeovirgaceae bacterium]|nr:hypothetical protein [Flammeovirgaceae bacterium]|tara:strand:+ start:12991 stop:13365 length:375 start_codon:yes stop_codon:yes gene_type:complete